MAVIRVTHLSSTVFYHSDFLRFVMITLKMLLGWDRSPKGSFVTYVTIFGKSSHCCCPVKTKVKADMENPDFIKLVSEFHSQHQYFHLCCVILSFSSLFLSTKCPTKSHEISQVLNRVHSSACFAPHVTISQK